MSGRRAKQLRREVRIRTMTLHGKPWINETQSFFLKKKPFRTGRFDPLTGGPQIVMLDCFQLLNVGSRASYQTIKQNYRDWWRAVSSSCS